MARALILAVLLVAQLLAQCIGDSIVLCLEPDGSVNIETKRSDCCARPSRENDGLRDTGQRGAGIAASCGCVDISFESVEQGLARERLTQGVDDAIQALACAEPAIEVPSPSPAQQTERLEPRVLGSAALSHLRTVVLRC